jgi:hypothetical protein
MPPLETEVVVQPPMSRPHYDSGTNGQFNDEYDEDANEKMSDKHYIMPKRHVSWQTTPIINNLPGSVDDEFYDDYVFTQVDLSMIRNASENALVALGTESFGVEVEITSANCVRVSRLTLVKMLFPIIIISKHILLVPILYSYSALGM